jgi:ABC-type antimicrobial peptide transport system ATPase subunit
MPTHAVKFAHLADKIIIMKKGRVVKYGSYQEVK